MRQHCFDTNCCRSCKAVWNTIRKVLYGTQTTIVKVESEPDKPIVPDIPVETKLPFYVGNAGIVLQDQLTEQRIKALPKLSYGTYNMYKVQAQPQSFFIIAVPQDKKAYMHDVINGKVPFYTAAAAGDDTIWYYNGEYSVIVDGNIYDIYGLFTVASGELHIYIE